MPTPLYMPSDGAKLGSIIWICPTGAANGQQNASLADGPHGSAWMAWDWAMRVATAYKHEQPSRYVGVVDEDGHTREIA